MTTNIGVMQLIDTLEIGGAERVAVNLANHLPRTRYISHLCSTRRNGALAEIIAADVQHLSLHRRNRFDIRAIARLVDYIRANDIRILHAHGSSLFITVLSSLLVPTTVAIWHDHFGRFLVEGRPVWLYRMTTQHVYGVIAVTQPLAEWARNKLNVPEERVWFVPNFVCTPEVDVAASNLPGYDGFRIVCVANLRPEKGHLHLIRAMKFVSAQFPKAHLLIVGSTNDPAYFAQIQDEIQQQGLSGYITLMGQRQDVAAILNSCDIGVISSLSEGLPLALLEYGNAELPVVSTDVGQCREVLDDGQAGLLVNPADSLTLVSGLIQLLESPALRKDYGKKLNARVQQRFSIQFAIDKICSIYAQILSGDG